MFEFPCIISLYYIKNQQDAALAVLSLVTARSIYMFRKLSASIIRSTKNCSSSHWCMSRVGMIHICPRSVATAVATDPWHAPVVATTVFSTPDDGRRKLPKHV